ncbi:MAG: hypothetical protein ACJAQ3_001469 [Planctomycetota bacterium]|jgi:hypothetical protein
MLKTLPRALLLIAGASTLACHSRVHAPYRVDHLATGPAKDPAKRIDMFRSIARDLDGIAYDVEEYGTISASTPVMLLAPSADFKFDLGLTPREIFNRRMKSEASSRVGRNQASEVSVALALNQLKAANSAAGSDGAEAATNAAHETLAQALVDLNTKVDRLHAISASTTVSTSPPGSTSSGDGDSGDDGDILGPDDLLPRPKPLVLDESESGSAIAGQGPLDLSLRQLIQLTFDDWTTLKLFELMSEPDPAAFGQNKILYTGVMNVSIRPGRRTYEEYVGEIDVRVNYARRDEWTNAESVLMKEIVPEPTSYPLAFAVFPGIDSQVMDQGASIKESLALAVAIQGMAKGTAFDAELRKTMERSLEARSKTGLNAVVGFNASGRHFGWRCMPRFMAQGNPSSLRSGPGMQLQAQTFPALILCLADRDDLDPSLLLQEIVLDPLPPEVIARVKPSAVSASVHSLSVRPDVGALLGDIPELNSTLSAGHKQDLVGSGDATRVKAEDSDATAAAAADLAAAADSAAGRTKARPHFNVFEFSMASRWLRAPSPVVDDALFGVLPIAEWAQRKSVPRWGEMEMLDVSLKLDRARRQLDFVRDAKDGSLKRYSTTYASLFERYKMLESNSVNANVQAAIPKWPNPPVITARGPAAADRYKAWFSRSSRVTVAGTSLDRGVLGATVAGTACTVMGLTDKQVSIEIPALHLQDAEGSAYALTILTTAGPQHAGYVEFTIKGAPKPLTQNFLMAKAVKVPLTAKSSASFDVLPPATLPPSSVEWFVNVVSASDPTVVLNGVSVKPRAAADKKSLSVPLKGLAAAGSLFKETDRVLLHLFAQHKGVPKSRVKVSAAPSSFFYLATPGKEFLEAAPVKGAAATPALQIHLDAKDLLTLHGGTDLNLRPYKVRGKPAEAWKTIAGLGAGGSLAADLQAGKGSIAAVLELYQKKNSTVRMSLPVHVNNGSIELNVGKSGVTLPKDAVTLLKSSAGKKTTWVGQLSVGAAGSALQSLELAGDIEIVVK